ALIGDAAPATQNAEWVEYSIGERAEHAAHPSAAKVERAGDALKVGLRRTAGKHAARTVQAALQRLQSLQHAAAESGQLGRRFRDDVQGVLDRLRLFVGSTQHGPGSLRCL